MNEWPAPEQRIVITSNDLADDLPVPLAEPGYSSWATVAAPPATQSPARTALPPVSDRYGAGPVGRTGTNGMAIASLVCGFLGISVLALVFGYVARSQLREPGNRQEGHGLSTAGIVLGWVGLALVVLYFVVIGLLLAAVASSVPAGGG